MAKRLTFENQLIQAGTTTINLDLANYVDIYRFYTSGSITLAGNLTVGVTGTPVQGEYVEIVWEADLNFDGNSVSILGTTIPEALESVVGTIKCYYNGSAWTVQFYPKVDETGYVQSAQVADSAIIEAKIGTGAVTTDKIGAKQVDNARLADDAVGYSNRLDQVNRVVLTFPVSFETGEQANNSVVLPYGGTLESVRYEITKAVAGTDAATITPLVNRGATTPTNISISASTAINTDVSTNITAGNTFATGQELQFVSAKTTAGGKALLTVTILRA